MANKIKITVDSTCDMTPELCRQYDVTKIPLSILLGAQAHDDGIDITPDDIYAYYERTGTTAKTAAVPPSAYLSLFEKYTKEGYEVVHLGFTAKLSSSFQNAVLAAGELEGVFPVDTKSLCTGMALLVIKACEMRDAGLPAKEIAEQIALLREKVHTTFILNTLDYLSRGGDRKKKVEDTLHRLLEPVVRRNIPFAPLFGNHDGQVGCTNQEQMQIYQRYEQCVGMDDPALPGCGTYDLPIYSNDGQKILFNLYLIDSHGSAKGGGYAPVDPKQMGW